MALKQVGMIADFSELHDGVLQRDLGLLPRRVNHELVVLLDTLVDQLLLGRQLDLDDHLNFLGQLRRHLDFESSQQKRPQNLMQSVDDQQFFFFCKFHSITLLLRHLFGSRAVIFAQGFVEPLLEILT